MQAPYNLFECRLMTRGILKSLIRPPAIIHRPSDVPTHVQGHHKDPRDSTNISRDNSYTGSLRLCLQLSSVIMQGVSRRGQLGL